MSAQVLFLDSADLDDVRAAAGSGIVAGVTTNPILVHSAAAGQDPLTHLAAVMEAFPHGPVFLQLHARDADTALVQAAAARRQLEHQDRIVFKLPAQSWWYGVGARLRADGCQVAITAVYTPGQVLAAVQCGASWVIPYVDRARRLRPGAPALVTDLAAAAAGRVGILAASVKSPQQAVEAITAGASAVTASWPVLASLMSDELTDTAVEEFHAAVST